jgi:hypothetical protein
MSINKKTLTSVNPLVETRDVIAIKNKTGNLYESIVVMSRRANQISVTMKEECTVNWMSSAATQITWKKYTKTKSK